MEILKENIRFLCTRYEPSFYIRTYLMLIVGFFITRSFTKEFFSGAMLVVSIINIITYPFTRFFYFSCKEWLLRGKVIHLNNIFMILLYYYFKAITFLALWVFSWFIGGVCITYILLNSNAKKYLENKRLREEYDEIL